MYVYYLVSILIYFYLIIGTKPLCCTEKKWSFCLKTSPPANINSYVSHLREKLILDQHLPKSKRYLFTSSRTSSSRLEKISHSNISNALTSTFKAANVYKTTEKDDRVSPSRIRASVATELAGLGDEDLKVSYLIIELCFVVCFH